MDDPKNPPVKTGLLIGACMFLALFLSDAISGFAGLTGRSEIPTWITYIKIFIFFIGAFMMIRLNGEKRLNGYSTYGRALGASSIAVFFFAVLAAIYHYIFYTVDPEAMDSMVDYTVEQMKVWISDEDKLEDIANRLHENKGALGYGLNALIGTFIFGFVISLIVSAFQQYIVRNFQKDDIFSS